MLKVSDVCKSFNQLEVLKNISFEVPSHTVVGLAGPSGSGKSTLLRCIQKLEPIDKGTITCSGATGFLFQDFQLFPHINVLENVTYAPRKILKNTQVKDEALNILKILGIEDKASSYPLELSGGQKQRVALARTLAMKPDVLLCDEPTSGLDIKSIQDVISILRNIQSLGMAMIITSHDIDFLTTIADHVLILKQGVIVRNLSKFDYEHSQKIFRDILLDRS